MNEERDIKEHLRWHLVSGHFHDDCPYCDRRRMSGGTGVTTTERQRAAREGR